MSGLAISEEGSMKLSIVGSVAALIGVLAGTAPAEAQNVSVDASVRLSDDVIVGVSYGRAYVRGGYVYSTYYPDYHRHPVATLASTASWTGATATGIAR